MATPADTDTAPELLITVMSRTVEPVVEAAASTNNAPVEGTIAPSHQAPAGEYVCVAGMNA